MDVFALMTAIAGGGRFVFVQLPRVATFAEGNPVLAYQRIGRVAVVVEEQRLPIPFRMTAFTLLVEALLVDVVLLVAGIAVARGGVFVQLPGVAGLALCRPMLPPQRILRIVVVLKEEHFPIPFSVTAFTLLGKLPLMLVVLLVAGVAVGRSLILVQVPLMARFALSCDMPSP